MLGVQASAAPAAGAGAAPRSRGHTPRTLWRAHQSPGGFDRARASHGERGENPPTNPRRALHGIADRTNPQWRDRHGSGDRPIASEGEEMTRKLLVIDDDEIGCRLIGAIFSP